jgi:hypothetical protein
VRAVVGGGFPTRPLSVWAAGSQFPMTVVPSAPSSNRTSGFPQYGFPTTFPACLSATVTVDTRVWPPWAVRAPWPTPLFRLAVLPPVGDCLARAGQSVNMKHGILRMLVAMPARAGAFMHPSPCPDAVEAWPHALEQVLLSCPSSLQGHSDFPSARTACLAGFIQLGLRLSPSDYGESRRISGPVLRSLSSHAADLTPGPLSVHMPSPSRQASAFPHNVRGRRVARSRGFIPLSGSPSYSCQI